MPLEPGDNYHNFFPKLCLALQEALDKVAIRRSVKAGDVGVLDGETAGDATTAPKFKLDAEKVILLTTDGGGWETVVTPQNFDKIRATQSPILTLRFRSDPVGPRQRIELKQFDESKSMEQAFQQLKVSLLDLPFPASRLLPLLALDNY